ncbi:MAG: hypothetical protein ACXADO_07310, partial [Candidatus Thorarchaeota archaeon]
MSGHSIPTIRNRKTHNMRFFGHLIKGETTGREGVKTGIFPDMNRAIEDPRILLAMALREQGSSNRFAARYLGGLLPEKTPEIRLLKDHIKVHGYPRATNGEIDD